MGKTIRRWLFNMHHIVIYCTVVYVLIMLSDWFTVYYRDSKNPILVFAYISLIHIPSVFLLRSYLTYKRRSRLFLFVVFTTSWIILTIVFVVLIYLGLIGRWTLILWQGNPLHHIFLAALFAVICLMEIMAVIELASITKTVGPD